MIIDDKFFSSIHIGDFILCTTILETSSTICRCIVSIETHKTTSWLCYAKCSMDKCLYLHQVSFTSHKLFWYDFLMDSFDLWDGKFASEYHTIRKLCKKFYWLIIGDRKLNRNMYWYVDFITVLNSREIKCYNGIDIVFFGCVDEFTHNHYIMIIEQSIDDEISFDLCFMAHIHNIFKIFECEIRCCSWTHIKLCYSKIYGISTSFYSCSKRFITTSRRHNLSITRGNH